MPFLAGIDCGTSFTKAVVLSDEGGQPRVLGKGRVRSGVKVDEAAWTALEEALKDSGLNRHQLEYIAATGFGRYSVSFRDIQVTEITTAARGAHFCFPQTTAILDIGGGFPVGACLATEKAAAGMVIGTPYADVRYSARAMR